MWVAFALCILTSILGFFIFESPSWYVQNNNQEEAIKVIKAIAKWNRAPDFEITLLTKETFKIEAPKPKEKF